MRSSKIVLTTLAAAALLAVSVSSADARWFGHRGGRGPGIVGGVILGAATIATLPFAILAGAANAGSRGRGYDVAGGYGPPRGAYGPPQGGYGYGPPPGAYEYGPPPGAYDYGPSPPRYYRGYGPPAGYYGYGY